MNCAVHTDTAATAYCRTCGKALCENCKRDVMGAIYCEPCIATRLHGTAPGFTAAAPGASGQGTLPGAPSPAIALCLGFIPGVGAMYNGQFTKAFIHVIIFVLLIVATSNYGPVGILIAFWVIYMAFEAYKTAEAKQLGLPAPDPIGLDRIFGIQEKQPPAWTAAPPPATAAGTAPVGPAGAPGAGFVASGESTIPPLPPHDATPTGAIVLIALGVLFLLSNFGIFSMRYFWPLLLIAIGLWIAYQRTAQRT